VSNGKRESEDPSISVPAGEAVLRLEVPTDVRWIVRTLEEAGYETWAVGGAVRNVFLGIPSDDWDLATRATPGQVRRIFRRTVPIGIRHGTVGVLARDGTLYEVTTFRRDVITTGRHAVVEFADRIEDDLSRRDFTINAIAWHPLREEIYDPFGGVADLQARVLRTVGDPDQRFEEDYLRVLRALRFAGRFRLEIAGDTWAAIRASTVGLDVLSRERVREELMKVLGADPHPSHALELYRTSGVLAAVAPELSATVGLEVPGGPADLDLWSYGVAVAQALTTARPLLRLVALLQGVGLPESEAESGHTPQPQYPRRSAVEKGVGSEGAWKPEEAAARAAALMIRLRFSNAQVELATSLLRAGPVPLLGDGPSRRHWLSRVGPERLPQVVRLWIARARVLARLGLSDAVAPQVSWRAFRQEIRSRPPLTLGDLAFDGRDLMRLGMKPGPQFRAILLKLLDCVLDDPSLNRAEMLAALVRTAPLPAAGADAGRDEA